MSTVSPSSFKIRTTDDFHCHLRRGEVLRGVAHVTASRFRRAVVMPNTDPPILTAKDAEEYRREILRETVAFTDKFEPLMTIKLVEGFTTPLMIRQAKDAGIFAGKAYPVGTTTGSEQGIADFEKMSRVFVEMERIGMPLLIHGESPKPDILCLDREREFIGVLFGLTLDFPDLKIVMEHLSTKDAVESIKQMSPNVAGTITAHHLALTLDDMIGGKFSPHNFCKPIAKRPEDREALIQAVISGNPKFFFGSDSAPHLREKKECDGGAAGIFSAPVALLLLAEVFESNNALDKLENFVSVFGAQFYGLPLNEGKVRFTKDEWIVPSNYCGVVPFLAGKKMSWSVARI